MVEAAARVQSGLEKGMVEAAICVAVAHVVATAMSIGPWCVLFVVMSIMFVGASAVAHFEIPQWARTYGREGNTNYLGSS